MHQKIELDFYIPAKDSEKYIRPCLESVFSQTYQPRSITLYLHTPCQDRTRAIAEEFFNREIDFRICEVNVPLSDVRNIAIRELTTDWIGCCDVDVVLAPDWLEKLWAKHTENYTIIAGNTQEQIKTFGDKCRSLLSPHNWGNYDVDNPYNFAPDMIAKRKRLVDIGGYKSGLFNYEDSEICLRLKQAGDLFYYVADARATHIREDDFLSWLNQRWNYSFPRQKELFQSIDKFKRKILNNIALTTVLLQKLIFEKAEIKNLIDVLHMPIHHFKKDLTYIEKNNPSLLKKSGNQPYEFFLKTYSKFYKNACETIFRETPSYQDNPYAVDDIIWQEKIISLLQTVQNIFQVNMTSEEGINISTLKSNATLPKTGFIYFRQKLFPSPGSLYTCKDLTEFVAFHKRRLLWTETFQGSTICAFTTENLYG